MPAGAGVADGAVTLGTVSAVTVLTAPVTMGSALAVGWTVLAEAAWVAGCAPATVPWTVWTIPVTAGAGADTDGTCGAGPVLADEAGTLAAEVGILAAEVGILTAGTGTGTLVGGAGELAAGAAGLLVLAAGAAVPLVVFWLAGAGWAVGCTVATVPWTAWVALWTTSLTAEAGAGEVAVWVAALAPDAVAAAAGALAAGAFDAGGSAGGALAAGVLDAGVLGGEVLVAAAEAPVPLAAACPAGGGWLAGCDPLADPWAALPAAATVDPAVDPAVEATDDTAEVADETTGGTAIGFCAADAGRAQITVRIKPSMKVAARPPQAYKHARRVQAPTFVSPTLEQMGTFPSTARKPRKTLRYLATAPHPLRAGNIFHSPSPATF